MPVYGKLSASVGHTNVGYLYSKRGAGGRFSSEGTAAPAVVEAWRWPSFRVKTKGLLSGDLSKFVDEINSWAKHVEGQSKEILENALNPTFNKSRLYCPKDTLDLVRSARMDVSAPKTKGGKQKEVTISISYGKGGLPFYAIYVHEMLSYRHEPPTRAKFLESALKEDMAKIKEAIKTNSIKAVGGK